ncbi:MAG: prephenate dehydrogenase [Methanobacterium sp.]|nr:prephenate dehydrogenase [Methanobacterium sp.]
MQVAVIGGTRGLGNWFADFLKNKGYDVTITGRNKQIGMSIAKKMGLTYNNSNQEAVIPAKLIIIAVPIETTPDTIREIAPYLKEGSLLVDVTSIKEEPARIMQETVPEGVEFLPAHPMFGPRVRSLDGQVVVLTPLMKGKWYQKVIKFLESENARIIETSPQIHDKMMSIVQGLTHFTYISIASTLEKMQVDVKESRKFASPIYSLMLDMIARITAQNPYLCYSIQTRNHYIPQTHEEFLITFKELTDMIKSEDKTGFVKAMSKAAKHLDDLEAALGRSDKAISALNQEINLLKNSIGKEVGLRHIYSGKVHVGNLKELSPDFISLSYNNKTIKLKASNIEILSKEQLKKFKYGNYPIKSYDVSVVLPESSDSRIIAHTIGKIDEVVNVKVMDVYQGSQIDKGSKSITFRFGVINSSALDEVQTLLVGFGGKIR